MQRENHNAHEFMNEILEYTPTGLGIFDYTDGILEAKYLNDGYYQMIHSQRDHRIQFEGTHVVGAIYPDDQVLILQEAQAAIRENRMVDYRIRVLTDAGNYIWVGIRANHVSLSAKTERFYAVYYDINNYVQMEKYNHDIDTILSNIPGGVSLFSYRNGNIHLDFTNEGFYELHHGSREYWEKQSDNPVDWLIDADRHVFEDEFRLVNEGRKIQGSVIYRITGEDGNFYWVNNQFRRAYEIDGIPYFYAAFVDMDELKNAEAARDEAKRIYETAVEKVKLVIWEYDIGQHRVIMSRNKYTVQDWLKLGLPECIEHVPDSILPFIEEKSVAPFVEMYKKIDAGEPFAECEIWYNLKNITEPRCMHIIYSTVYNHQGKPVKAYGIGQNITVQKQAQEEYDRLKRERAETLLSVVSSFELNLSRNCYISGYSPYSVVMKKLKTYTVNDHFLAAANMIISQDVKSRFIQEFTCDNLLELFKKGQRYIECEYSVHTSFGGIQWIRSSLRMLQNPRTGDVEGVTYSFDITKEKRNEAIIHRITSTSSDFVSILDIIDGTIQLYENFWNVSHLELGKKLDAGAVRQFMADTYVMAEERKNFLELTETDVIIQALQTQPQYVVPYDFYHSGNVDKVAKKQLVYGWLNKDHREILVLQQDVTQAYLAEQRRIELLETAKKKADAANIAKTNFLSRLSHDIRTPLNAIINMTAFAHEDIGDKDKVREELKKIGNSSQYLLSLINDILDISKAESGKIELHPVPYAFNEYITSMRNIFEPICEKNGQTFVVNAGKFASGKGVIVDKVRFNQIAMNLLSNAIKYTPPGGTISYQSTSRLLSDGRIECSFTIADTGIGMSPQFQQIMFEPFAQEHNHPSRATYMTGTGLGLSIVKRLVDLMNGSITVESNIGNGTKISVCITLEQATQKQLANCSSNNLQFHGGIADIPLNGTVLLAEDNDLNAEIAERILTKFNLTIVRAKNGKEALLVYKSSEYGAFKAILMDIQMPVLNGYEATMAIRSLNRQDAKEIPIIAMTADAFSEDIQKCMRCGMNGHVAKPIEPSNLYHTLAAFLQHSPI